MLRPQAGAEASRDWLPGTRSVQRAAALLAVLAASAPHPADGPQPSAVSRWAYSEEHDGLAAAVIAATSGQLPPGLAPTGGLPRPPPSDKRSPLPEQVCYDEIPTFHIPFRLFIKNCIPLSMDCAAHFDWIKL